MPSPPVNKVSTNPIAQLSVVIPVHNGQNHIRQAIESVLNQSYQPIEIIVIDDGSTDNTRDVIKDYIDNSAIRYVYQAKAGAAAARNTGIKLSSSTYICFLDHDDYLETSSVKERFTICELHPTVGLVFSDFQKVFLDRNNGENGCSEWFLKKYDFPDRMPKNCIEMSENDVFIFNSKIWIELVLDCFIQMSTVLIPRAVLEEVGFFNEQLTWAEDHDLWLRIAQRYDLGFLQRSTAFYRQHASNLTLNVQGCYLSMINVRHSHMRTCAGLAAGEKKRFRGRIAELWYYKASCLVGTSSHFRAIPDCVKAIMYNPMRVRYYTYLLLAMLGPGMVQALRRIWKARLFTAS
jgi:glycosyltransferase involved in cell wall biosynthesis